MKALKTILKWMGNIFLGLLVTFVLISVYLNIQSIKNPDKIPSVFGLRNFTVLTGSMMPYISPGDMIVSKEITPLSINVGDIITYKENDTIITHRVIEKKLELKNYVFKTKGDANNIGDENFIKENQIIGKQVFKIPFIGHVVSFMGSKLGIIFIVIILALMFGLSEFKSKPGIEDKIIKE
ncbi:MAG: signal peptidase I [Clostridium sp.]|uniref:signal peptidase I n=1 Tax=Clostridium sp. TaxID=1506 RepID=UPI003D6D3849